MASAGSLILVDTGATAATVAVAVGKLAAATFPAFMLLRALPRRRRLWAVPLAALLVLLTAPLSLAACAFAPY